MLNSVHIIGHLGADPELRQTTAGPRTRITVATTESWKDGKGGEHEKTEWHRVVVWGRQAEVVAKRLRKGARVFVDGKLETSSYDKDGATHHATVIVARAVTFLDRAPAGGGHAQR